MARATHRCLRRFLLPYGIGSSSLTTTEKPASVRSASVRRKLTTYKAEISGRHSRQTYQADTSGRHIRHTNRPRRHQDTHFGYTSVTHQLHSYQLPSFLIDEPQCNTVTNSVSPVRLPPRSSVTANPNNSIIEKQASLYTRASQGPVRLPRWTLYLRYPSRPTTHPPRLGGSASDHPPTLSDHVVPARRAAPRNFYETTRNDPPLSSLLT